jgi:hypothetical protein
MSACAIRCRLSGLSGRVQSARRRGVEEHCSARETTPREA